MPRSQWRGLGTTSSKTESHEPLGNMQPGSICARTLPLGRTWPWFIRPLNSFISKSSNDLPSSAASDQRRLAASSRFSASLSDIPTRITSASTRPLNDTKQHPFRSTRQRPLLLLPSPPLDPASPTPFLCQTPCCVCDHTMASIDRYRPPGRESYQPPTRPPANAANTSAHSSRPSKSPSKRRDVPPAVPSPPTHYSARNSEPPSQSSSRRTPAHSSTTEPPKTPREQWFFTQDEINSSPSILDGISPTEERLRRAKGVNFIYQAGVLLDLPQITLYVAGVFFHRFYMRTSMVEEKGGIHHYVSSYVRVPNASRSSWLISTRTSRPPHSSWPTRPRRTAARRKTSSSPSPGLPRKTPNSSLTSSPRSTGGGVTASSTTRRLCWRS